MTSWRMTAWRMTSWNRSSWNPLDRCGREGCQPTASLRILHPRPIPPKRPGRPIQRRAGLPNAFFARIMPRSPGRVAQLVEQGIENPRVGGSIPSPATTSRFQAISRQPETPAKTRGNAGFLLPGAWLPAHSCEAGREMDGIWTGRERETAGDTSGLTAAVPPCAFRQPAEQTTSTPPRASPQRGRAGFDCSRVRRSQLRRGDISATTARNSSQGVTPTIHLRQRGRACSGGIAAGAGRFMGGRREMARDRGVIGRSNAGDGVDGTHERRKGARTPASMIRGARPALSRGEC